MCDLLLSVLRVDRVIRAHLMCTRCVDRVLSCARVCAPRLYRLRLECILRGFVRD